MINNLLNVWNNHSGAPYYSAAMEVPMSFDPKTAVRYLRIRDLVERLPISKPTIYRLAKLGQFPPPIKMGSSSVWVESEVEEWLLQRHADRDQRKT